ncbi:protein U44 [Elephant endotheliotropic herpesvirus 5B]|uniref:Tegument protein UL51 homolog n=1 Tax=Elephant endotheliotropic herpesvirus 5 TaxID=768738 RepID=A0A075CZJ5_9BETA|nr:tegument protein UL51 [Elephant endotheliotropic herpesvirus 5]AHC02783.1 tegument protein UL51 [Elephant endotheliotropic herpesvirus 5]UVZ35233.1 protein U44 [Elephant endotheliotropic herpesvirus 5B]
MGALCDKCLRPSISETRYETLKNEMDIADLQTVMSYNLGLSSADITQLIDNEENKTKLLEILPTYMAYKTKLMRCEDAKDTCVDHLRDIVDTELHKLQFIIKSLEIIMFKIAMGNLEISDTQIEALATKYATDQTTLSDLEKSLRVINEDRKCSFTLMKTSGDAMVEKNIDDEEDSSTIVVSNGQATKKQSARASIDDNQTIPLSNGTIGINEQKSGILVDISNGKEGYSSKVISSSSTKIRGVGIIDNAISPSKTVISSTILNNKQTPHFQPIPEETELILPEVPTTDPAILEVGEITTTVGEVKKKVPSRERAPIASC